MTQEEKEILEARIEGHRDAGAAVQRVYLNIVRGQQVYAPDCLAAAALLLHDRADELERDERNAQAEEAQTATLARSRAARTSAARGRVLARARRGEPLPGQPKRGRPKKPEKPKPARAESFAGVHRTTSPSLLDRHIARAANPTNTTIKRRGRAPSAGEPCAPGSTRHRFSKAGDCRVPGCSVQRAVSRVLADAATPAARQPELPTPTPPGMPAPAAKPRKRMTIELPDGTTTHPGEDADV